MGWAAAAVGSAWCAVSRRLWFNALVHPTTTVALLELCHRLFVEGAGGDSRRAFRWLIWLQPLGLLLAEHGSYALAPRGDGARAGSRT